MNNYNFDTSYGRDALEKFVKDYAAKAHETMRENNTGQRLRKEGAQSN